MVKMLTVLVSTVSNSPVFLLQMQKLLTFFNDQSFNDMLPTTVLVLNNWAQMMESIKINKTYILHFDELMQIKLNVPACQIQSNEPS